MKDLFALADENHDGQISREELTSIFEQLGSDIDLDALLAECDVNKDGKLDYNEFIDFIWNVDNPIKDPKQPTTWAEVDKSTRLGALGAILEGEDKPKPKCGRCRRFDAKYDCSICGKRICTNCCMGDECVDCG